MRKGPVSLPPLSMAPKEGLSWRDTGLAYRKRGSRLSFIADLHIHSPYSIATSRDISPETLYKWAQLKGVKILATGDFTHPSWLSELKEKLEPVGNGLFILKKRFRWIDEEVPESCKGEVYFILSSEISCIYKKNGK